MLASDWISPDQQWSIGYSAASDNRFSGVVVIRYALQTEGREFEPRGKLFFFNYYFYN